MGQVHVVWTSDLLHVLVPTTLVAAVFLPLNVSTYSFMATTLNAVWATLFLSLCKKIHVLKNFINLLYSSNPKPKE